MRHFAKYKKSIRCRCVRILFGIQNIFVIEYLKYTSLSRPTGYCTGCVVLHIIVFHDMISWSYAVKYSSFSCKRVKMHLYKTK